MINTPPEVGSLVRFPYFDHARGEHLVALGIVVRHLPPTYGAGTLVEVMSSDPKRGGPFFVVYAESVRSSDE